MVNGAGILLTVAHTAANVNGSKVLEELVEVLRPIRSPRVDVGRPRKRPKKLHDTSCKGHEA